MNRLVNDGVDPMEIRAPQGPVTWRQFTKGLALEEIGSSGETQFGRSGEPLEWTDTEHDHLLLHHGGFADVYEVEGKTIVCGTGLSGASNE